MKIFINDDINKLRNAMKILSVILSFVLLGALPVVGSIRPNQTLKISITGVPPAEQARLNSAYQVSSTGYITMWKIGRIKASGISKDRLAATIAAKYKAAQIYNSPVFQILSDADIRADDNRMFTVGGQVKRAGQTPWSKGMTLYGAVQAAGGETPYGSLKRVKLYRRGKVYTYNLKVAKYKNIKIYPDDIIEIPQKKPFES